MEEGRDKEEMTATEFANTYGKSGSWAQRLAKKAMQQGKPYPRKHGNYWFATLAEWETVLKESGIRMRNRKSRKKG